MFFRQIYKYFSKKKRTHIVIITNDINRIMPIYNNITTFWAKLKLTSILSIFFVSMYRTNRPLFQIPLFKHLRVIEFLFAVTTEAAYYKLIVNGNNYTLSESLVPYFVACLLSD